MPTLNTAARDFMATASGTCCATGTLVIYAGATALATHTMAGFGTASNGAVTANAIADVTIANSGTANSAKLIDNGRELTLSVGVSGSGAEVILSSLNYIQGTTSQVLSCVITYPSS